MQTSTLVATPSLAGAGTRTHPHPRRIVASATPRDAPLVQRRSLAAMLAAVPVLLPASRALALIPDDDDEELIEKARANRKSRLASERATEKAYSRSSGFDKRELIPVQRAINSLGLTGKQLAAGEVSAAASTLSDGWTGDFRRAVESLSSSNSNAGAQVVNSLNALQSAATSGSLSTAKKEYVALVGSLESWASSAGIAGSLKGL